jgi:methionine synthase I (cobalamin-dependent)
MRAVVSPFLEALHSGRVLLMDGAMGTELQRAGVSEGECYELWNLTHPERVRAIHQAYADAGAEVLLTNTFQANSGALQKAGVLEHYPINLSAIELARSVAGTWRSALLDVGPMDRLGRRQGMWCAVGLARGGADGLLVETASGSADFAAAVKYRRRQGIRASSLPILVSWTFLRETGGRICTIHGNSPGRCAAEATGYPIAALGVNCGRDIGLDEVIEIVRRYRSVTDLPLFARPNAGTPKRDGDRWVYPLTPEAMAARLPELLEAGVSMVGGCCGTTPEHIAACRPVIDAWNARRAP